jgi:quercetin dioxygenase-like cupin family protein
MDIFNVAFGMPRWYQNVGKENFEFLCLIPNKEDKITL